MFTRTVSIGVECILRDTTLSLILVKILWISHDTCSCCSHILFDCQSLSYVEYNDFLLSHLLNLANILKAFSTCVLSFLFI